MVRKIIIVNDTQSECYQTNDYNYFKLKHEITSNTTILHIHKCLLNKLKHVFSFSFFIMFILDKIFSFQFQFKEVREGPIEIPSTIVYVSRLQVF